MIDRTNRERQARFAARVREQGLVKICEWIPAECRDTFKRIAAEMRGDAVTPPSDATARVRQAHGWGWTRDAIAAYAGVSVDEVDRIVSD